MPIFILRDCALLVLIAIFGRHLAREHAGRDGVDPNLDTRISDFGSEHLRDVVGGTFARVVGKMILGLEHDTRDGGDVDDGGRETRRLLASFCEEWQEGSCHEVDLSSVGLVDLSPVFKLSGFVIKKIFLEFFG